MTQPPQDPTDQPDPRPDQRPDTPPPPPSYPTPSYPRAPAPGSEQVPPPPPPPAFPAPSAGTGYPNPYEEQGSGKTSGFAIAGFVLSFVIGIGLPFAIAGLVKIRRHGHKGRGLAIAGIVISSLWILLIGAGIVIQIVDPEATRDENGKVVDGGRVVATELRAGDCFNGLRATGEVREVRVKPCAEPHEGEVFAVTKVTGPDSWPGTAEVQGLASDACSKAQKSLPGKVQRDASLSLYFLHPLESPWEDGDRRVICIAGTDDQRSGSVLR